MESESNCQNVGKTRGLCNGRKETNTGSTVVTPLLSGSFFFFLINNKIEQVEVRRLVTQEGPEETSNCQAKHVFLTVNFSFFKWPFNRRPNL